MTRIPQMAAIAVFAAVLAALSPRPAAAGGHCVIVENDSPWIEVVVCEPWV